MKRIGYLMEQMLTEENFVASVRQLAVNHSDDRMALHLAKHADRYGKQLLREMLDGTFQWSEPRNAVIKESCKQKERKLKIPCKKDQAAQLAWLRIAVPHILKRNYYYNCGSIPGGGQTKAVKGLRRWLKDPRKKYGATTDIRKFYETCPHWAVRKGLCRIFKDRAFVEYAMGFASAMSPNGVGLAIGYPASHWLANVALMELDHALKRRFPRVKMARFMDDVALTGPNRRQLKKAVLFLKTGVERLRMRLKKWSVFRIKDRGLTFLSYRFFNGFTLLRKPLMVRIAKFMRTICGRLNAHVAAGALSYFGILKWCNSFRFRQTHVYPFVNRRDCIKLVAEFMRKRRLLAA